MYDIFWSQLQQITHDCVEPSFEHLQGLKLNNISGQPVSVFDQHNKKAMVMFKSNFPHISSFLLPAALTTNIIEKSLTLSSLLPCYLVHASPIYLWGCYGSQYPLIVEGYQVGQTWFPLHKPMLTTLSNLPVTDRFGNAFQGYFFQYLPRDHSEANQPSVSQILLLAPRENREWHLFFSISKLVILPLWGVNGKKLALLGHYIAQDHLIFSSLKWRKVQEKCLLLLTVKEGQMTRSQVDDCMCTPISGSISPKNLKNPQLCHPGQAGDDNKVHFPPQMEAFPCSRLIHQSGQLDGWNKIFDGKGTFYFFPFEQFFFKGKELQSTLRSPSNLPCFAEIHEVLWQIG